MDLTFGHPFWPVNDGLIRSYPRLDTDARCDVAVLGGGITGALVTQHLVAAGIDTVVLDKRDVASGSTAASTGLLQYEIDVTLAELTEMRGAAFANQAYLACRGAIDRLGVLAERLGDDVGFARKQSLYLGSRRRDQRVLRKEWELRRAIGLCVDYLEESHIAARFAFRRPAALLTHDAAQVDPYAFAHALLRDAAAHGARIFDRTAVEAVDATSDGVKIRTAAARTVRAKRIVFATGYETGTFLKLDVARLVSTYAVASEPVPSFSGWGENQCEIWEHRRPYLYLRTTHDHRVIIGGEDEDFRNPLRRDRLVGRKAERLAERFRELFPSIAFDAAYAWAGTFGETRDGLAYIGEHRDWPNAYFALGYGGNGITFSLLAAEIIRDAVLGRRNEHASLFRFDR